MRTQTAELKSTPTAFELPPVLGGPPDYLWPLAAEVWNRVVQELGATGLLHESDREMLAAYCSSYALWRDALAILRRDGMLLKEPVRDTRGKVLRYRLMRHPAVSIARDELNLMRSFGALFGLDPKSRRRLENARRTTKRYQA